MKVLTTLLFVFNFFHVSFGKTINLDTYLAKFYRAGEYQKCYNLCKVINKNHYTEYTLAPFNIKYKDSNLYSSDSCKYYEYHCQYKMDPAKLFYLYVVRHEEVKPYFSKEEIDPSFFSWADSLYNSPVDDGTAAVIKNRTTKRFRSTEDIPEVKAYYSLNRKLREIYYFLQEYDSIACNRIFNIENAELIKIVKNRSEEEKDLLALPVIDFNLSTCNSYTSKSAVVETKLREYYAGLFKYKRFVCLEQISEFLYTNTSFSAEEKMFVTFHFVSCYIHYEKDGRFTDASDITNVILYRHTVCNGYALLMEHFLRQQKIECFKIDTEKACGLHSNNLVIIQDKVYYFDATWDVYFKEIKTMQNYVDKPGYTTAHVCDYTSIKDLSYISSVPGYDTQQTLDRLRILLKH